jgi:iron complex outermembrane receptor protein
MYAAVHTLKTRLLRCSVIATFAVAISLTFSASISFAQDTVQAGVAHGSNTGTITGTIQDPRGSVLLNAAVVVKNEATGLTKQTKSDLQGHYTMTGLPVGKYSVEASSTGFELTKKVGIQVVADQVQDVTVALSLGNVSQQVTVEAASSGSIAAQLAPMDGVLEARSAKTEISAQFIQNFASPVADSTELLQMAPGTFSVNSNGVGLGDSKTYFRGFQDGLYDITFDGIPYEDTNSPTHHSWAFFPSPWIGGVDFDRSPGGASTVGPTPFGGSINLLSRDLPVSQNIRGGVSYGSFNTLLVDGEYESGNFGGRAKKSNLFIDVHHLTSDGFQTFNYQQRDAGSLKYQYKFSDSSVLTGFAGVIRLTANTPNAKGPTRTAVATLGYNYLMNNDPTSGLYVGYNSYHVPTDFEYIGFKTVLGHGWLLDTKPYTYSYYNAQYYANTPPSTTSGLIDAGCTSSAKANPCAVNKLNSYRKYGEITTLSQVSKYGVFRTGLWYEWAATDRYQIPSDPRTRTDDVLPNFHEKFWTNSYQPYAEYEFHATRKLTLTGGFKFAFYTQDLKQFADNGKTVGSADPITKVPFEYVRRYGTYKSYLPSFDANYRLASNWSVYGQFSTGSVIPPSNVFDVKGTVTTLPKPTGAKTYQGGSVLKLRHVTLNVDGYYTKFDDTYTSSPDPNVTSGTQYQIGGSIASKGFEGETNLYLTHGVSLYANGTVGSAHYISQILTGATTPNANYQTWVASTPANTEALGLTYQQKYFDAGIFNKRVGPMWNDATGTAGDTRNQVIPIDPFNVTNLFFNYTVRNGGHFDQTKLRLSFNNLLDNKSITSQTQKAKANVYTPGPLDTLGLLPGRSVTLTVTFGYTPKR